jgi:hypothetical protein
VREAFESDRGGGIVNRQTHKSADEQYEDCISQSLADDIEMNY